MMVFSIDSGYDKALFL